MTRELICIGCPMGCRLTAEIAEYAKKECVAPMRTVTGTVALRGGRLPVLPVRTNGEVPKEKVLAVADALRRATAQAPIHAGDVVLRDVCGTGVDVIAVNSL